METERAASDFGSLLEQHLENIARFREHGQPPAVFNWVQISQDEVLLEDSNKVKFQLNYNEVDSYIRALGLTNISKES